MIFQWDQWQYLNLLWILMALILIVNASQKANKQCIICKRNGKKDSTWHQVTNPKPGLDSNYVCAECTAKYCLKNSYSQYQVDWNKVETSSSPMMTSNPSILTSNPVLVSSKIKCPKCRSLTPKESAFCLNCGIKLINPLSSQQCRNCGAIIPPESNFCLKCGAKIDAMPIDIPAIPSGHFCPVCNAEIPLSAIFCGKCGRKVSTQQTELDKAPPIPPPAEKTPPLSINVPAIVAPEAMKPLILQEGKPLSRAVVQTLSVIALQQPIPLLILASRRGPDAFEHVKLLEELGLIKVKGTGETPDIVTTDQFAEVFGLNHDIKKMQAELREDLDKLYYGVKDK